MNPEPVEAFGRVFQYASPFIAAGLATWLSYLAGGRQRKSDVLMSERLAAFKSVQTALIGVKRYCAAAAAELHGSDLGRRPSDLGTNPIPSALSVCESLSDTLDANAIFFSPSAWKELDELLARVSLLASMELADACEPGLATPEPYDVTFEQAEKTMKCLYGELGLPT